MCVWHSIGSAPGHDTDLRPVSLEPAWPEPANLRKKFPEKWPVAKSRGKKFTTVMLFYGKNLFSIELMDDEWDIMSEHFY